MALLTHRAKAGYGAADLGMSGAEVMMQLYLLEFYTRVVGLRAEWAGIALALAVLWDAVSDPLMGVISDHTRSRFGMRRGYIFAGGLMLAAAFLLLFTPPALESQPAMFAYLLGFYLLTNTGMTIIAVPHYALAGEMSFDRNQRTTLFGWRLLFKNGGFFLGTLAPGVMLALQTAEAGSRGDAAAIIAAVTILTAWITVRSVKPFDPDNRTAETRFGSTWLETGANLFRDMIAVGRNRVFLPLILAFVLAQIGRTINASLALYYYKIRLGFSEEQVVIQILGVFILVITLSIAGWVLLSKRFGKKWPAFWGALLLGVLTAFMYPLFTPGEILPVILVAGIGGGGLVGSIILFESLVADIVDYDELRSGRHREGLYFGCWMMATKASRALGLAFTGIMLNWTGYVEGAEQQATETGWRLALLFGPGVGLFFIIGALVFALMPLTDKKHEQVQRLLEQKRKRRKPR